MKVRIWVETEELGYVPIHMSLETAKKLRDMLVDALKEKE